MLEDIERKLRKKTNSGLIRVSRLPNRLSIDLDTGEGLEKHENLGLAQKGDDIYIEYFALFKEAFRTFFDKRYEPKIEHSPVLLPMRQKVEIIRGDKKVEIYDLEREAFYSRIVSLSQITKSYEEAEKTALFFMDVFNEKAERMSHSPMKVQVLQTPSPHNPLS
ncbi:hypothetical protein HY450_03565 [Candidatus Pacearchaeota archaeon]|nr:hypothetical protein [Candidatus Pacearchaeota archaeon]